MIAFFLRLNMRDKFRESWTLQQFVSPILDRNISCVGETAVCLNIYLCLVIKTSLRAEETKR